MEMIAETVKAILPADLQRITYIGEFPTDADLCVALTESGGLHSTYFAKDQLNTPYLKISIRSKKYDEGYLITSQLKTLLTSYSNHQEFGMVLVGDIMYFGRDDKRRNAFQLTYKIYSYIGG